MTLVLVLVVLVALIVYEVIRFADTREHVRHQLGVSHDTE